MGIKDKRSCTVVRAMKFQVLPFLPQVPCSLLTDNGGEFTSTEFESFLNSFSIKHKLTTPFQPTSNGCVERVNKSIKNLIRSLTDSGSDWDGPPAPRSNKLQQYYAFRVRYVPS